MFWLYFTENAREATMHATPVITRREPQIACVVMREPPENSATPAKYCSKRQQDYRVRSARITQIESQNAELVSPLNTHLQRLSVDGEHAFGIWDEEAGFSLFSANFERVTGLSSGECAGHEWIHSIHHTQQYAVNDALLAALDGVNGRCLVQARRLKEGAEERWLMLDIKAATVRQPSVMVLIRDLSEQKALEEALKQTQSALAMSERSRAAFLSSMSHELRTPLNAIMGFSEMMKSGVFGKLNHPTYQEYATHIHDSGSALLGKINDLLDIASMDAGGLELEEDAFHLSGMLTEVIELHTHHAFTRLQKIKLDCPHRIEIMGDRAKLMCAISHLVTNALRHSKDDAEITLSVRVQPEDGIIISVRDVGEGIAQGQLDIIRGALNAEVAYFNIECGGIGLGLSLTKELASRHGGRVMIDSVRHRGTVVSLILPTSRALSGLPLRKRRMQ